MTVPNSTAPSGSSSSAGGGGRQIAFLQEVNRRRQSKPSVPLSTRLYRLWTIDGRVKEAERARSSVLDLLVRARDEGYMTVEEYKDCMLTVDLLVANQNRLEKLTWWQKWAMIKIIVKENRMWKYKMLTRTETSCRNYIPDPDNSPDPLRSRVEVEPSNRAGAPNIPLPLTQSGELRYLMATHDQPCSAVTYISSSTISERRDSPVDNSFEAMKRGQDFYTYQPSEPDAAEGHNQPLEDEPVDAEKGAGPSPHAAPEAGTSTEAPSTSAS